MARGCANVAATVWYLSPTLQMQSQACAIMHEKDTVQTLFTASFLRNVAFVPKYANKLALADLIDSTNLVAY